MIDMKELLAFAVEQNASDIQIATGIPPKLRINGRLTEVELDRRCMTATNRS